LSTTIPSSDYELMQRVADSDPKALEILYNRYSPLLYPLIKKIVDDELLAQELLAEIFLILWRKVNHFDFQTRNVYAWLVNLTRNKAVDALRRRRDPDGNELYSDDYENRAIIPLLSPAIDPLDLVTVTGIKNSVENAFNRLTEAQQYVLSLSFYEGFSEQEIAKQLKIPLPTVKSKIKQALSNFRDYLIGGDE